MSQRENNLSVDPLSRRDGAAIFFAALIFRLAFLAVWTRKNLEAMAGYDNYVFTAQFWAGFLKNVNAVDRLAQAPVFVGLCALLFKIAGRPDFFLVRLMNIFFSAATSVLVAFWSARASAGRRTAITAGLLAAASPALIYFSPQLQTESLFVFLEMLFFLGLVSVLHRPRLGMAFVCGLVGGLAILTRPVFLLYVPFLVPLVAWRLNADGKRLATLAFLVIGWLAPWILWKQGAAWASGGEMPIHPIAGRLLYTGIAPRPEDRQDRIEEVNADMARLKLDSPIDQDRFLMEKALRYIRAHPAQFAGIVGKKLFRYWRIAPYAPFPLLARWGLGVYHTFLYMFAAAGLWKTRGRRRDLLPVYAFALCLSIIHAFLDTTLRYRLPLEPFLDFFAAGGLMALAEHLRRTSQVATRETTQ